MRDFFYPTFVDGAKETVIVRIEARIVCILSVCTVFSKLKY